MHRKKTRHRRPPKSTSCVDKVPHPSKDQAVAAARRLMAQGSSRMEWYKCRHCPAWHIGHQRKSK